MFLPTYAFRKIQNQTHSLGSYTHLYKGIFYPKRQNVLVENRGEAQVFQGSIKVKKYLQKIASFAGIRSLATTV